MKIVELDSYAANPGDLSWKPLQELADLVLYDRSKPDEVVARAKDADAILINKINITREVIEQLPRLKYIGELATGYNNIDLEAAREHGIVVSNIPSYSTDSVAQLVFAHILNVTNRVDSFARQNREGRWSRNPDFCYWDEPLHEIAGKTIGIVGLGHIGMRVAAIAHAFGMNVSAMTSKLASDLPEWIQKVTFEGLLAVSDFITLHCPLVKDGPKANYHIINGDALAKVRPGTVLINTGRGPLVDEQAVADALESGQLQAYCADVMAEEPPKEDNPLTQQPHAYITPHVAWATVEARTRLMDICVANVKAFIEGHPQNVVD